MSPSFFLQHYGYVGVVIALMLEFLFIPFPAETILVISGVMWHRGVFSIGPLLLIATLGSWSGSMLAYYLGSKLGRPVLLRYGKYVKLDEKNLTKAEVAFRKYSILILGVGRFIAGIRVLIAYVAGINKMSIGLYAVITLISATIWSAAFILLGGTIGAEWHVVAHWVAFHRVLSVFISIVVIAGIVYLWWRRRNQRRSRSS